MGDFYQGCLVLGGSQQSPRTPPPATVLISGLALNLFLFWAAHALREGRWWQHCPLGLKEWDVARGYGATMDSSEVSAAGWGLVAHLMGPGRGESGPGLGMPGTWELGAGVLVSIKPDSLSLGTG